MIESSSGNVLGSGEVMLGEPVTRPDGKVISLHTNGSGDLKVDANGIFGTYSAEELIYLGNGNWQAGVSRVAQASYLDEFLLGSNRCLSEELGELRSPVE